MAHFLFNLVEGDGANASTLRDRASGFMRLKMWGIDSDERHRSALARGDLVLIYLGAPEREFIGRAELASAAHDWTAPEAEAYPGACRGGVSLAHVEEWVPSVPIGAVLPQLGPDAKADFDHGVVRITAHEYETALGAAAAALARVRR